MLKKIKNIAKKRMETRVARSIQEQESIISNESPTILGHWFYELEKPRIKND